MLTARSSKYRVELSHVINLRGITMRSYSNCEKSSLECRKSEHSKKYSNYIKRGYRYNTAPLSSDEVSRYLLEHDRLETEE